MIDDPVSSLCAFAAVQALLWFMLSQPFSPIIRAAIWFVKRVPGGPANVFKNVKQQCAEFGLAAPKSEESALEGHVSNYVVLIHHSCGTALLIASYMQHSETLFRMGSSFEIGEGLQHALQLMHAYVFPPGTQPIRNMCGTVRVYIILHHSLGLLGGPVVHLYLSGNPDVQLLCALLCAAPLPGYMNLPLFALGDLAGTGPVAKINICMVAGGLLFMLYSRVVIFFPICLRITPLVFAEHGAAAGCALSVGLVLFSLFNVAEMYLWAAGMAKSVAAQYAAPRAKAKGEGSVRSPAVLRHTTMPNHELHTARATRGALRPRGSSFSGAAAENTSKVESESESQAVGGRMSAWKVHVFVHVRLERCKQTT